MWSTGQAVGGAGAGAASCVAASEARAWASQASRVLWSTGQASLSAMIAVTDLNCRILYEAASILTEEGSRLDVGLGDDEAGVGRD